MKSTKKPRPPVTLEASDYERLMRLGTVADLAKLRASLAQAAAARAQAAHDYFLKELSVKYPALRPEDANYKADEATHSLIPQASAEEPPPR